MRIRCSVLKIYTMSLILNYCESIFWLLAIIFSRGDTENLSQCALYFAVFLIVQAIFDAGLGTIEKYFPKYYQVLFSGISLCIGGACLAFGFNPYLSYLFLGLGLAAKNGSSHAWFREKIRNIQTTIDDVFYVYLEYSRRWGQFLCAVTTYLLGTSLKQWRLFSFAALSLSLLIIFSKSESNSSVDEKNSIKDENKTTNYLGLFIIFAAQLFYGIDFGIRNLVTNPFVLYELNSGEYNLLALKSFTQVLSGFAGNKFYLHCLKKQASNGETKKHIWLFVAMVIYGSFMFLSGYTYRYEYWICLQIPAIFSMGWYMPMINSAITELSSEKHLTTTLSLRTAIYSLVGSITLYIYSSDFSQESLRFWLKISGLSLYVAGIIYLLLPFGLNFAKNRDIKKIKSLMTRIS